MKLTSDMWIALVLLALTSVAGTLTHNLSSGGVDTELGPAFFPWLMVSGLALFSLLLLGRGLWLAQEETAGKSSGSSLKILAKLSLFLLYMILYATFYVKVGYLLSTGLFFILAMLTLGERRVLHFLLVPAGVTIGVYLIFTQILNVYIP